MSIGGGLHLSAKVLVFSFIKTFIINTAYGYSFFNEEISAKPVIHSWKNFDFTIC